MFKTFRLHKATTHIISDHGNSAEGFSKDYKPTNITFKARNQEEATRKGRKFWQDAEIGMGSFIMLEE